LKIKHEVRVPEILIGGKGEVSGKKGLPAKEHWLSLSKSSLLTDGALQKALDLLCQK
jgi:hypothetical protein